MKKGVKYQPRLHPNAPLRRVWPEYGQEVVVRIDAFGEHGEGEGTQDGRRYRVFGALPGETVRARVFKRRKGWRSAQLLEVLEPSPHRIPAPCPAYGVCGGCSWQSLAYAEQVAELSRRVHRLLDPFVPPAAWEAVQAAESPWHYRAKIEMTFSGSPGALILGFNWRGRFDRHVDVAECLIGPPSNAAIAERVRAWANRRGHAAYDPRRHDGFLRFLVIRQAWPPGEAPPLTSSHPWLAALVTATPPSEDWGADELARSLADLGGGTLLHAVTDAKANTVRVDRQQVLLGSGRLDARLDEVAYEISTASFFQSNQAMAERLVRLVRERAALTGRERVLDLYCGVGTMALALARSAAEVEGIEFVPEAVDDARRNAERAGLTNTRFAVGAAEQHAFDPEAFDLILLDPPRGGVHPRLLKRLVERPAARIIYVSCNPTALALELETLTAAYDVVYATALDLFPHTPHVETVVELARKPEG